MNKSILILILLLSFSLGGVISAQSTAGQYQRPTLHMFVIGEMKGGNIGAISDYPRMQMESSDIAHLAGLGYETYFFEKENLSANALVASIRNLECGPDDVIWFYYSGHGYNSTEGSGNFSSFLLSDGTEVPLEWVHEQMAQKKPRLNITVYDACNYEHEDYTLDAPFALTSPVKKNYIALFGETSGSIKMSSNSPGYRQFSYGSPQSGSIFTTSLLQALTEVTNNVSYLDCTWFKVAELASTLTEKYAIQIERRQKPYFELDIRRHHQ